MITHLKITFYTEGEKPTAVVEKLHVLGFRSTIGESDLEYEWDQAPSVDDVLKLGDKISHALKGSKVGYTLKTR